MVKINKICSIQGSCRK
ncbi:hypothetical protein SPND122_01762 [Streptococcus pneumoniae]|nr:hypothetical protein SPND122_01762 [Streptococcus pneumoniae]